MKRKIMALLATLAMAAGLVIVVQSPAAAAYDGCPANKLCAYWNFDGGAPVYYWSVQPAGTCTPIGGSWNDNIRSFWNRTSTTVVLHKDAGCNNSAVNRENFYPGTANVSYWLYDLGSSIKW